MYVKLSWIPEVNENWAIMVVQPAILTYPTMVFYNKYVRRVLCLIYISSFYFWSPPLARKIRKNNVLYFKLSWIPEVDENWAIMVVQPAILTYPTMVFYFWLAPRVLWNDLRWIVIKQRHWQTFWGIIHVDYIRPLIGVNNVKPMSGGRLK
jgi:hypothetical protein